MTSLYIGGGSSWMNLPQVSARAQREDLAALGIDALLDLGDTAGAEMDDVGFIAEFEQHVGAEPSSFATSSPLTAFCQRSIHRLSKSGIFSPLQKVRANPPF
jgi:hypothetical protein